MKPGDRLTLAIEKPAAGGRMIARHDGAVVLVAGAIPGETVEASVEKVQRGTTWARTMRVVEPSPDRIDPGLDGACGGSVLAHIRYPRQLAIKREIIRDAFTRIGRLPAPDHLPVHPSPVEGYRMRARLHLRHQRIGFFREGSHDLCAPGPTRQLLPSTLAALAELEAAVQDWPRTMDAELELSENAPADERALHLDLAPGAEPKLLRALPALSGLTGLSYGTLASQHLHEIAGSPYVTDVVTVPSAAGPFPLRLRRHVRSFFQGNRFVLPALVAAVVDAVPGGRVVDLYAGVGVFAVALAARGEAAIVAVEGDRRAAADLRYNAGPVGTAMAPQHQAVEEFLAAGHGAGADAVIVDPPRTGLSQEAAAGVGALAAPRLVYVSCDVATLARDARVLTAGGYRLTNLQAFDLFPHTAHVESVAVFER